jgi:hypothetical protein
MSAAAAPAFTRHDVLRRFRRYSLATPVDVVVLRSGVPESIPGRSINVCEGGMGAVVAGELRPGQAVGIELRLPNLSLPIQARASVRYQTELVCGLEFLAMSAEQKEIIRYWAQHWLAGRPEAGDGEVAREDSELESRRANRTLFTTGVLGRVALPIATVLVTLAVLGWWSWERAWTQLEGRPSSVQAAASTSVAVVPWDVMAKLLIHKVDPEYPEAARATNANGIVVVTARIGRDGSVLELRPIGGPGVLTPAVLEAVKWWRFQPYEVHGRPTDVETTLAVEVRP